MPVSSFLLRAALAIGFAGAVLHSAAAQAPAGAVDVEPSVWDLTLGLHAAELPTAQFVGFACGTNGGPPSTVIAGFTDFARCAPDEETGWHEVYFRYDDDPEYVARAYGDLVRIATYEFTSVYSRPVIATALFDDDGFMRGLRLVTDPRVDVPTREQAYQLGGFLQARYDGDWQCENLPRIEGESAYRGIYIKRRCILAGPDVTRTLETNLYRRPGQSALDANGVPTVGYFESEVRLEEFLVGEIPNREARLAAIAAMPPPAPDPLVARAMNCPGCDLAGAQLERANLRNANLAGANLEGANLHAADLTGANLEGANLRNANLNLSQLTLANLAGATLSGAMLYGARLDGAKLMGAQLMAVLAGQARMIRVDLSGAIVTSSDLTGVFMTNAVATNANFSDSRFWGAQMSRSDLSGATFEGADLLDVVLVEATLVGTKFTASYLGRADFRDANATGADFSRAYMVGAILARTTLSGATFEGALLPGGFTPPP